jgi:hypothetical protein
MEPATYQAIARHVTKSDNWTNFASSILAGWLKGVLSWLLTASKVSGSRRMAVVYLTTAVLACVCLHHGMVGNIDLFASLISLPKIT